MVKCSRTQRVPASAAENPCGNHAPQPHTACARSGRGEQHENNPSAHCSRIVQPGRRSPFWRHRQERVPSGSKKWRLALPLKDHMKKPLVVLLMAVACASSFARGSSHSSGSYSSSHSSGGSHSVSSYTTSKGTHVAPSHATNPNTSKRDNWSSKGNVNPHTGKAGTK